MSLSNALLALKSGKMIAVYDSDDREGEADLIFPAGSATPERIELLRKNAGGLICLAISKQISEKLGLPFMYDLLESSSYSIKQINCSRTAYGDRPAFSIYLNHKKVYTGITDKDRSLTIKRFSEILLEPNPRKLLLDEFYSPGHVPLLISSGIEKRKGHTELAIELAKMAGIQSAMVLCEMLGSGSARSKEEVIAYCKKNKIQFIEGKDIYGIKR